MTVTLIYKVAFGAKSITRTAVAEIPPEETCAINHSVGDQLWITLRASQPAFEPDPKDPQ